MGDIEIGGSGFTIWRKEEEGSQIGRRKRAHNLEEEKEGGGRGGEGRGG